MIPERNYTIISDRSACIISVITDEKKENIHQCLSTVRRNGNDLIFVPDEVVFNPSGYQLTIRHKQSLKESLAAGRFNMTDMLLITECIEELINFAKLTGIALNHICFDYAGIFTDSAYHHTTFVYIPDQPQTKEILIVPERSDSTQSTEITDLFKLLSLHLDWENSKSEDAAVAKILETIENWEKSRNKGEFPFQIIKEILKPFTRQKSLKSLISNFFESGKAYITAFKNYRKRIFLVGENLFEGIEKEVTKQTYKIGRDEEWSDLNLDNILVGRKHAEIIVRNGVYFVKDMETVNGTYINGKRIRSKKEVRIKINDLLGIGNPAFFYFKIKGRNKKKMHNLEEAGS